MRATELTPGVKEFFLPDSLWFIPDHFFYFDGSRRWAKDYSRPGYLLAVAEIDFHTIPCSKYTKGESLKESTRKSPWTVFVAAGTFDKLKDASMILTNYHEFLPGREVTFSGPSFIGQAPDPVRQSVREKLNNYVEACFE
jgi:hypothetical protein